MTADEHAEIIRLAPVLSDVDLASRFRCSLPTIRKYKAIPIGAPLPKMGRPKAQAGEDAA